jgi:hypothetical protein
MYIPTVGITDISFFARPLFYFLLDYKIEMLDIFFTLLMHSSLLFIVVVYSLFFQLNSRSPLDAFLFTANFLMLQLVEGETTTPQ